MSIWKEVKIALNSTLGTSSFLSLDKMIENAKEHLSNKSENIQTDVASVKEDLSTYIRNSSVSTTGEGVVLNTFTCNTGAPGEAPGESIRFIAPVSGIYKISSEIKISIEFEDNSLNHIPTYKIVKRSGGEKYCYYDGNDFVTRDSWDYYTKKNMETPPVETRVLQHDAGSDYEVSINNLAGVKDYAISKQSGLFHAWAGEPVVLTYVFNGSSSSKADFKYYKAMITYGND